MAPTTRSAAARKQPYPRKEDQNNRKRERNDVRVQADGVTPLGSLSNHIHPIFRPGNLHLDLIDIEEAVLTPVLRLASQFLLAQFNLPFWHTLFFGDVQEAKNIIYSSKRPFEFVKALQTLNQTQRDETERALEDLSTRVKIRSLQLEGHQSNSKSAAYTRLLHKGLAMITLNRESLSEIADYSKNGEHIARMWCTVCLALTLVHELAHAAVIVTREPGFYFFPDSLVAEEGFELETRLLGGHLRPEAIGKCPSPTNKIVLLPWPNQIMVAGYVATEGPVGLRLLPGQSDITSKLGDCAERVDPLYLECLFEQSFWDFEVPKRGQEALRPWTLGWRFLKGSAKNHEKLRSTYKRRRDAWLETRHSNHDDVW